MDDARKKQLKTAARDRQRQQALAALPLPIIELEAIFDMLDAELPEQPCDHTRRLTRRWLEARGHNVDVVFAWLDTHGGYCDCEVLANVEDEVDGSRACVLAADSLGTCYLSGDRRDERLVERRQ